VRLLTAELKEIGKRAASRTDVDYAYTPKRQATEEGVVIHKTFETFLSSAYADYERTHIRTQQEHGQRSCPEHRHKRISPIKARYFQSKSTRRVSVPIKRTCRIDKHALRRLDQFSQHNIIDLAFSGSGCKSIVTTYTGHLAECPICGLVYLPPGIERLHQRIFGRGFMAWVAYQRVALRLPLGVIARSMQDVFAVELNASTAAWLVSRVADEQAGAESALWRQVLRSPVIHVDETRVNVRGSLQYVWVFTDGEHVTFRLTLTRETEFLHELLAGYQGTLVSDFYPGYDAIPCRHQKCLVHLIRDLNDDLWKNPFDAEYELFVVNVRNLLVPILGDVEKYGLNSRHLRKHQDSVERFYKKTIDIPSSNCEITAKYQKRFSHYRESLFTFLNCDGVPWHNNMAERAIRHFAIQRKISGYFYSKGAIEYLRLLGIVQTCRFQRKSFLHFLLSGSPSVDEFKEIKRRRRQSDSAEPEGEVDAAEND
jgi:hypothetical protein